MYDKIFFFKGCLYYEYDQDPRKEKVKEHDIFDWGLPCDINSALAFNSWTGYFFKDDSYFEWHQNRLSEKRNILEWNIDLIEC